MQWLRDWIVEAQRALDDPANEPAFDLLHSELSNAPEGAQSVPALIGLHQQAAQIAVGLASDPAASRLDYELSAAMLARFEAEVGEALDHELRRDKARSAQAWREWVQECSSKGNGWVHKWTRIRDYWKPLVQPDLSVSCRPTALLSAEAQRLSALWEASDSPPQSFTAPADSFDQLADITCDDFCRAFVL